LEFTFIAASLRKAEWFLFPERYTYRLWCTWRLQASLIVPGYGGFRVSITKANKGRRYDLFLVRLRRPLKVLPGIPGDCDIDGIA
jgi:hypothetical protein